MMYKIMNELVDLNPVAVLLEPRNCSFRGHKYHSSETVLTDVPLAMTCLPADLH